MINSYRDLARDEVTSPKDGHAVSRGWRLQKASDEHDTPRETQTKTPPMAMFLFGAEGQDVHVVHAVLSYRNLRVPVRPPRHVKTPVFTLSPVQSSPSD